uniref:Uncharacterized protein n=1 Tax=Myotis myotis TaxID=51298 RepID=A0A7J7Z0H9_MYOMY|nr:hypothetical protein mMyoMyo1_001675 [Myotis myotis]
MAQHTFHDREQKAGRTFRQQIRKSTEETMKPKEIQVMLTEALWDQVRMAFRDIQKEEAEARRCLTIPLWKYDHIERKLFLPETLSARIPYVVIGNAEK